MNNYLSHKLKAISFLSIIMVICSHAYNITIRFEEKVETIKTGYHIFFQYFLSHSLTRIAVPIFFIISGYLFFLNIKKGLLNEFLIKFRKRVKTLILPYLFWSIYGLLLFLILQSIPQSKPFFTNELIRSYSIADLFFTIFLRPIPYQFWFIKDIIVLVVFAPIIYWAIKYFNYYFIGLLFILWFLHLNFVLFSNDGLFFFAFVGFLGIQKIDPQKFKFKKLYLIYIFGWILLAFAETYLIRTGFEGSGLISFFHKASILAGIPAIWFLYDHLFINKDISKSNFYSILQYTFFIYAFHEPVLIIVKKLMYYILGVNNISATIIYIVAPVFTISMAILIGAFLKRVLPKFYYFSTGGR